MAVNEDVPGVSHCLLLYTSGSKVSTPYSCKVLVFKPKEKQQLSLSIVSFHNTFIVTHVCGEQGLIYCVRLEVNILSGLTVHTQLVPHIVVYCTNLKLFSTKVSYKLWITISENIFVRKPAKCTSMNYKEKKTLRILNRTYIGQYY